MKKIFLLTLMALLCSAYTLSQNVVKGYVRDAETDEPLVGVSVQIEGTLSGTQTGLNGEYSLQVEGNKTLIFSYVGYETRLIEASDATVADVKLKIDYHRAERRYGYLAGSHTTQDTCGSIEYFV